MKLYLDSADVQEIRTACSWGIISGVTTNPSLLAKAGGDVRDVLRTICSLVDGPVSAECVSTTTAEMVDEAGRLTRMAAGERNNIVVKIPMTIDGIAAVSQLSRHGIRTNVTLVFSANQGILAASAGAAYVSPFAGRLDDIGQDGMELVGDMADIFASAGYGTEIIAASIRHPVHVTQAARVGAHIATIPFGVLKAMYRHPLTDAGVEKFLVDWEKLTGSRTPVV